MSLLSVQGQYDHDDRDDHCHDYDDRQRDAGQGTERRPRRPCSLSLRRQVLDRRPPCIAFDHGCLFTSFAARKSSREAERAHARTHTTHFGAKLASPCANTVRTMGAVFERVVVGVDGTDLAFEALRQALVLAPAAGSTVRAVTALDTSAAARTGFDAAHWTEALTREATTTREKAEAILGGRPGTSAEVVTGDPVRVLRDTRDELDATLLAVGGQHSSRFLGILLGDVGTQLLRDDKSSVLVARPGRDRAWEPRAVVVGLDGSAPSLAALLRIAVRQRMSCSPSRRAS